MKRIFTKALCLVCAGALALSLAACGGKADSAASSTASSSALGSASDYDYQNFNYSDGLDEKGYWEGIRALDYVTLPEDFASVAIKRSDVEPTSEEVEEQISDLLSQYSSTEHITDRAAADGDTVNINYAGMLDGIPFDGGTVQAGALVGRQVLIGNACVTVTANTASSMTVDAAVTAEDNAIIYPGEAGAQGRDVYVTLVLGADGYGTTEITGGGLEHIVKQLGSAGTGDPLNQRASVGWKATKVAVRLDDSAIRRIETCSTYTE